MLAAQYGTVSDIEVVWVVLAIAGMVYSVKNFLESRADIRALDDHHITNGRRKIAILARYQDGVRAIIHTIFGSVGVLAMTIPDAPLSASPLRITIISALLRWGLIVGSLLLVSQSYMANRLRRDILRTERHALKNEEAAALMLHAVENLSTYADEAEARRVDGKNPDGDVKREEQ